MRSLATIETFRSPWLFGFGWVCSVGVLLMFGVTAISGPGPHPGAIDYVGTWLMGVVLAAALAWGTRMRIEVDATGITAVNYFSTKRVPWTEYAGAAANYNGLWIRRRNGQPVRARGIARPNWAKWLHRETRCDRVLARLEALAQEHGG
jgi:hypothetical protein